MKIQHWAIIFLIIIIPFSIVCRNVINKKMLNLRDETRYNNIIDNATYDAVSQIKEVADLTNFGKNIPITERVADAAVDRFFNTLCVNFNLPTGRENAEAYFDRYIPAIIIVGYDGLYVYSCESSSGGYGFKWKPKIPYSEVIDLELGNGKCIINYTLDNYVKLFFTDKSFGHSFESSNAFYVPAVSNDGTKRGTHLIQGYVGEDIDRDENGINDFIEEDVKNSSNSGVYPNYDPAGVDNLALRSYNIETDADGNSVLRERKTKQEYINDDYSTFFNERELSYYLFEWVCANNNKVLEDKLRFLIDDNKCGNDAQINAEPGLRRYYFEAANNETNYDGESKIRGLSFSAVNVDYEFDRNMNVINADKVSEFHIRRRNAIINTIVSVMREEFNEHNYYAKSLGITYDFNIPNISKDQWNNTIDDVSVLAFLQGMPMGVDSYYNNYSLGGAKIVLKGKIYGEIVSKVSVAADENVHRVYHQAYCNCLAGTVDGGNNLNYTEGKLRASDDEIGKYRDSGNRYEPGTWYKVKYKSDILSAR